MRTRLALICLLSLGACSSDDSAPDRINVSSTTASTDETYGSGGDAEESETTISPSADSTSCYKGDAFICEIEAIISEETNKLRAQSGKSALNHLAKNAFVARNWSETMASTANLSHDGFPSERQSVYKAEFGESINFWAENVAMMSSSDASAEEIAKQFVDMWWNSPGHKANMLGDYTNIGSGVAKGDSGYYATQIFN